MTSAEENLRGGVQYKWPKRKALWVGNIGDRVAMLVKAVRAQRMTLKFNV